MTDDLIRHTSSVDDLTLADESRQPVNDTPDGEESGSHENPSRAGQDKPVDPFDNLANLP